MRNKIKGSLIILMGLLFFGYTLKNPGTTYENDSGVQKLVEDFILQLEIPVGAKSKYLEDYLSFTKS